MVAKGGPEARAYSNKQPQRGICFACTERSSGAPIPGSNRSPTLCPRPVAPPIDGLRAKRAYIAFLANFHFLQDRANFWQTNLF